MEQCVIKRNNDIVNFDSSHIYKAIEKAFLATRKTSDPSLIDEICNVVSQRIHGQFFSKGKIPHIEEIQNLVESTLFDYGLFDVGKSYILYREKRNEMRNLKASLVNSITLMDDYLNARDWKINENSNMNYSLQGLNFYISSSVTARYWLNKIYSDKIRQAHVSGMIHIHDLGILGTYCVGWNLYDLLKQGFGGVLGKIESKPPKRFRTALGQIVNFFYTMQGEAAGAQALSNFDTLLAPFIRYNNLCYEEVKQSMQEFLFNMNIPTRVGFQCLSEDTEILSADGWKKYNEIKKGDIIATFNVEEGFIEYLPITYVFAEKYKGKMYNIKSQLTDQLISPEHRVIVKDSNTGKYILRKIEDIIKQDSLPIIPLGSRGNVNGLHFDKDIVRLFTWVFSNSIVRSSSNGTTLIYLYKRKSSKHTEYEKLLQACDNLGLKYTRTVSINFGDVFDIIKFDADSSKRIMNYLSFRVNNLHSFYSAYLNMDIESSYLFIEILKSLSDDGNEDEIIVSSETARDVLLQIIINAGLGATVTEHNVNNKTNYVIKLIEHKDISVDEIKEVEYEGIIWCPNTKNETIIARRNGKVFITGNTPFTNLTFDLRCPPTLENVPVIIGGEEKQETYKEFQEEMNIINKAFCELMIEGDAKSRIFTFPIPTFNITSDFDYDNPQLEPLWEMTRKYGIPYFANFVNSDLEPHDVRSMCCRLRLDNRKLEKRAGGLFAASPLTGSIGVVTINLPRIAYISRSEEAFFNILSNVMEIAKDCLEMKRKVIEDFTEKGLYPYSRYYLKGIKECTGKYWTNHFSTIGIIGMHEACVNLLATSIASDEGKSFAMKVLKFMREKVSDFQEETGNLYNLEASPAEGTSYRLAKIDKSTYPDIFTSGTDEIPYYTNSVHLPVGYTNDIYEILTHQDDLQVLFTGGCIEKGNKIVTNKGLIFIEELVENFERLKPIKALSYNPETGICEWDEITNAIKIDVSKNNKIRIIGEMNLDITTSDWHPFFVLKDFKFEGKCPICGKSLEDVKAFAVHLKDFPACREEYKKLSKFRVVTKRADELEPGDKIIQNFVNLYPDKKSNLDMDLMWLIGFFISSGWICKHIDDRRGNGNNFEEFIVGFSSYHLNAVKKVCSVLKKYFKCDVNIKKSDKKSDTLYTVKTNKKDVWQFFFDYELHEREKLCTIRIPSKVKEAITKNNVNGLVAGMIDGNGYVSKLGNIEYYTVSEKLAEDLLEVLTIAGIPACRYEKVFKGDNEKIIYHIRIPASYVANLKEKLPVAVHRNQIKAISVHKRNWNSSMPFIRVKEVTKVDVEDNQFYDLTVKRNHNYLAGKDTFVFVHNTVVHLFIGEEIPNTDILKKLVKVIVTNFKLPYFSITPTFSICPVHGYIPGRHEICPFPHTEEDLLKYGIDFLVEEKDLHALDKNAFLLVK